MILESHEKIQSVIIPQSAVQENQSGRFVLTMDKDNKVQTKQLDLGRRIGSMWVVNFGLSTDDTIIVEGLQKVRTGVQVSPTLVNVSIETGAIETGAIETISTKPAQQSQ